jgi:ferrochelatase
VRRTGVLLANLGTPDAPTQAAVRRYLRQFLSDRRVVDLPPAVWWPILYGIVLPLRPRRSAANYQRIWTPEGSPLLAISRRQTEALRARLAERDMPVALGMRYGEPSIVSAIDELCREGVDRILVLPLYPQYSSATTASTFDAVAASLRRAPYVPEFCLLGDYHDQPWYIEALASSVREAWGERSPAERLIMSFHGMPEKTRDAGDPYFDRCQTTSRLLAEALSLSEDRWIMTFQSRFGAAKWLEPYTDQTLKDLAQQGVTSVDIICPGFAADCLETLEEIAIANRELFLEAGGKEYRYIPALNEREDHIAGLVGMVGEWA